MPWLILSDPEDGTDVPVPAVWEICDDCEGEGTSSGYLGAFTSDDWREQSDEFREDYLAGRYDRPCSECAGSGKVLVPDEEAMTPRQARAWAAERDDRAEQRHDAYLRERGIEY